MTTLSAYIDGIGLLGPGLQDWPSARAMLAGEAAWRFEKTVLPAPASLPPAEPCRRRRRGRRCRHAAAGVFRLRRRRRELP
jgi:hypothetical protein